MTTHEETLLLIRGTVASLPEADQAYVKEAKSRIESIRVEFGDAGTLAIALIGAEMAAAEGGE
jgi:hypothetical protein